MSYGPSYCLSPLPEPENWVADGALSQQRTQDDGGSFPPSAATA
jgi:hypothetical protein